MNPPGSNSDSKRRAAVVLLAGLLTALAGCGGTSTTSSTATTANALRSRQDALVAFYQAFVADLPARGASVQAAVRSREALTTRPVNFAVIVRSLGEAETDAQAWKRSMETLPATNGDLTAIQSDWVNAAGEEVAYYRGYTDYLRATLAGHSASKAGAERVESLRSKLQVLNDDARGKLGALVEQLGGDAAFRGRIDRKRVEEIGASLKSPAAG
jgi:hypothetical protein